MLKKIETKTEITIVVDDDGMAYPITECCAASGKGTVNAASGVCCRNCYAEVDSIYGMGEFVVVDGRLDEDKLADFLTWFGGAKAAA